MQNRRIHLEIAEAVQIFADSGNDARARDERLFHLRICDQVDVPLAVAHILIGQPVVLFGERQQGFGEEFQRGHVDGGLSRARFEHEAGRPHDVADIVVFERLEGFPQIVQL